MTSLCSPPPAQRGARNGSEDLSQLFGAYLHQDWESEYDDAWEAVEDFCSDQPADALSKAADQARAVLESADAETGLESAVVDLGLEYYPPDDGWTYRGWLTALEEFLRAQASAR